MHKVKIIRFVHTETQDGKSPLDGHFARAQEWIRNWILLNNNALTAAQIVTGLRSNGGMPNSISQLVELDMDKVSSVFSFLKPISKRLSAFIGRINDVLFDYPKDFFGSLEESEFDSGSLTMPAFSMRAFEYSKLDDGVTVEIDLRTREVRVLNPHQNGQEEPSRREKSLCESDVMQFGGRASNSEKSYISTGESEEREDLERLLHVSEGSRIPVAGLLSGIKVISDSALRRLQRRWKKMPENCIRGVLDTRSERQKDITTYAKRYALQLWQSGTLKIRDGKESIDEPYSGGHGFRSPVSFPPGWARRPKNGKLYGRKYIEAYREEITEMFERGSRISSEKVSAPAMWEVLVMKYPRRYDIPSEQEILGKKSVDCLTCRSDKLKSEQAVVGEGAE